MVELEFMEISTDREEHKKNCVFVNIVCLSCKILLDYLYVCIYFVIVPNFDGFGCETGLDFDADTQSLKLETMFSTENCGECCDG